jgi:hypothetical protein
MGNGGVFARMCVAFVMLQLLVAGSIYFFRMESLVLATPPVSTFLEQQRQRLDGERFWAAWYSDQRVWGYTDRHSIRRGEKFNVMLSHRPDQSDFDGRVEIYRIGYNPDGADRKEVWASDYELIESQETVASAASAGTGWTPSVNVETETWTSGYYTIDVVGKDGKRDANVAFMVVVDDVAAGDIIVKLSTNTYQAYSKFGGHSFYEATKFGEQGAIVSFDRPTYPAFFEYEYYYIVWLEELARKENLRISYITDFDLHSNGSLLDNYKLFISLGHDEYWSKEEFDAVEKRLMVQGKNVMILSGNTAYWQVRYGDLDRPPAEHDAGRQLICFKKEDDPISLRTADSKLLLSAKFRDLKRRPETMLIGVGYDSWFPPNDPKLRYSYRVVDNSLPIFEGTGWKIGESVGSNVVGYEWDNRDPERDKQRLWDPKTSAIAQLPAERIKVLFEAEPIDVDGKKGKAEAVYFETPAGAKVFNAGTIRWSWGVGKPGELNIPFQTFNQNLVLSMLKDRATVSTAPAARTAEDAAPKTTPAVLTPPSTVTAPPRIEASPRAVPELAPSARAPTKAKRRTSSSPEGKPRTTR